MSLNIDGKHMLIKSKEVTKLDPGFEVTRAVNQSRNHIGHIGLEMKYSSYRYVILLLLHRSVGDWAVLSFVTIKTFLCAIFQ